MGINGGHFQGLANNRIKVLLLKLACRQIDRNWMQDEALALPFVTLTTAISQSAGGADEFPDS